VVAVERDMTGRLAHRVPCTIHTIQRRALAAGAAFAAGLMLTGCTGGKTPEQPAFHDTAVSPGTFQLVAYTSCDDALTKLKQAAKEYVGPYGFGGDVAVGAEGGAARDLAAPGAAAAPVPAAGRALADKKAAESVTGATDSGSGFSGTNTHEVGVDEPDLVKTDGRRIVTLSQGVLHVVDPATRKVTGRLSLASAQDTVRWASADLLLSGDHALILINETARFGMAKVPDAPQSADSSPSGDQITGPRLLLVDLTGAPRLLSSYTIDGGLVDARQVGATVRVVIRSAPRLVFPYRPNGNDTARTTANKAIIDKAGADEWLPRYTVTSNGHTQTGRISCDAVNRPASYTGTSMLTVLSFDLGASALSDGTPVTVVADGDTVYSNGPSLYVATDRRYLVKPLPNVKPGGAAARPSATDQTTDIYKFDTSQPGRPRYVAAGTVNGWLINQYALSEWDGHLRVATTTDATGQVVPGGQRPDTATSAPSQSTVYVLGQDGKSLKQTGKVGGLGKGERIYAVRFVGPAGYVVTFRQTDPLYTMDLRNPAAPKVTGELKITGYSAYLHPAGDGRLIGIGQEASTEGRAQGTQVSLFDVSDPNRPTRLAQHHVAYGRSEAEFDPHAFLYWPADHLLVVPLTTYQAQPLAAASPPAGGDKPSSGTSEPASGALVLKVSDGGLTELGMISQAASTADVSGVIRRSLVVNGVLWTVSDAGLQANSLSTLDKIGWLALR
jgi:hypothetical protein